MNVFKLNKEERWNALVGLLVLVSLNWMQIHQYPSMYTQGGNLGFWSVFAKNYRMSGYDCWSYITISNLRIYYETARHPLYFSLLYPMYWLNHWLMYQTGTNFAIYFMAVILTICSVYTFVFLYRVLRSVMGIALVDAVILVTMFFGFAHVMVPMIVPDHFAISMFLLTMTLAIVGTKIKKGTQMGTWQTSLLLFLTSGITLTNGAKTILAALFANGKKALSVKFISLSVLLPLILLAGIYWYQYNEFEVPQKQAARKIERNLKTNKDAATHKKFIDSRNKWLREHTGKPMSQAPLLKMTDVTTPRTETVVENFFGESIQLHQGHLLEDVSFTRPVFVKYQHAFNYVVEALFVLLLFIGLLVGRRSKFLCMCMSWFAVDIVLHLVLGFGINEVYIMAADWIFIIPIAFAALMTNLRDQPRLIMRIVNVCLALYLLVWNGSLLVGHLLMPFDDIVKF